MKNSRWKLLFGLGVMAVALCALAWNAYGPVRLLHLTGASESKTASQTNQTTESEDEKEDHVLPSIPPRIYEPTHPGLSFGPSVLPAVIEQKTLEYLTDEVRHLKQFVNDFYVERPPTMRQNIIRKTALWKLGELDTRLSQAEKKKLLNWVLDKEGVEHRLVGTRGQLLRSIEPGPPPVPVTTEPMLTRLQKTDCNVSLRYPTEFDTGGRNPDYGHIYLKKQADGLASFVARLDFRQEIGAYLREEHRGPNAATRSIVQNYVDEDTVPPHPIVQTMNNNPDSAFILIGETQSYAASKLGTSDVQRSLGNTWYRSLKGTVAKDRYDGSNIALGYLGAANNLPATPEPKVLKITRDHCLMKKLARTIEKRHEPNAKFHGAYSLGKNEETLRMMLEFHLRRAKGDPPHPVTVFADLKEQQLVIRYVHLRKGDNDYMSDFVKDDGVTLLADRDYDGLSDLIYSHETGLFFGTLIILGEDVDVQYPQHSTD